MHRRFDIILFGASGFTGQLVAKYLALHADREKINWAIAGRDENKLNQLSSTLIGVKPEIIVANITDKSSLKMMVAQGTILMNTVGPFNVYGRNVVEACLDSHTNYIDITGEPSFVADIYNHMYERALKHQTCIVNCCGFDSIPADYAAWLTAKKLPLDEPKELRGFVRTNASFSGGTLTTAIQALHMEVEKKSIKTKIKRHPDAPKISLKIHFNKDIKGWAIPMPVVDPHIIKRSIFRMPEDFGNATSYGQFFVRSSFGKVVKTIVPIASAMFLVRFKKFRERLFEKYKPGTGPSEEKRANSKFEVICYGKTSSSTAVTTFSGGDPGYTETAKMFSEAAFTLLDRNNDKTIKFGVLTPVEAFGMKLVHRLRREGLTIE